MIIVYIVTRDTRALAEDIFYFLKPILFLGTDDFSSFAIN
jgi:hypothetical protein